MYLIIMGVSGSGKSTIGQMLSAQLGWPFYDGDDYHPPANIAKMSAGIPLTDQDRAQWLETLAGLIRSGTAAGANGIIACSALKQAYRQILSAPAPQQVRFVYLKGSYAVILERMQRRSHFMKPEMLASQFTTLQEPEDALTFEISLPPAEIVQGVLRAIAPGGASLGILGLGVMGRSLAHNFARHGYRPVGYDLNRSTRPGSPLPPPWKTCYTS